MTEQNNEAQVDNTDASANTDATTNNNAADAAASDSKEQLLFEKDGDAEKGDDGAKQDEADDKKDDENKAADGKEGEDKDSDGEDGDADKPVEYSDFIAPEGLGEISEDDTNWVKEFGKEHKLSQEQAQGVIDKYAEKQKSQLEAAQAEFDKWGEETKADSEIGGSNLGAVKVRVNDNLKQMAGTDEQFNELKDDLIMLGLGNKKSFIRYANNNAVKVAELEGKLKELTAEDNIGGSFGAGGEAKKSHADILFGGDTKT